MTRRPLRLLAIDLTGKGFGYALVDKKLSLLDWGFSSMRAADDDAFLARVSARIDRGSPTALVLENFAPTPDRPTATRRCGLLIRLATEKEIGLCQVSPKVVRHVLGVTTKAAAAQAIIRRFPELRHLAPRERKPWAAEDDRMHVFNAVALAVTILGAGDEHTRTMSPAREP